MLQAVVLALGEKTGNAMLRCPPNAWTQDPLTLLRETPGYGTCHAKSTQKKRDRERERESAVLFVFSSHPKACSAFRTDLLCPGHQAVLKRVPAHATSRGSLPPATFVITCQFLSGFALCLDSMHLVMGLHMVFTCWNNPGRQDQ